MDNSCESQFGGKKNKQKKNTATHPMDKGRGGMSLENSEWHSDPITAAFEHVFSWLEHSVVTSLATTVRLCLYEACNYSLIRP